ncbi:hypothetical protein AgCh_034080 [Apium graveolens]
MRKGSKSRPVALKVEEKPKEKARRKSYSKGKSMIAKSDTELSNSDDDLDPDTESDTDSDHNNNEYMDQIAALLVKIDCRKPRAEKKQALISNKRNWDDSLDSDDGINYALMENADVETNNAELKLKQKLKGLHMKDKKKRSRKNRNDKEHCEIISKSDGKITMNRVKSICGRSWNWHKRLSHLNFNNINELVRKDLVRGFPNAVFTPDGLYDSCQKSKQRKTSFKSKTESSIPEPYDPLYVDLFGPVNVMSISKKRYAHVIVDEFTRYTWLYFLHTKDETPSILLDHVRELEKGSTYKVKIIRSDNGTEFGNSSMEEFCKLKRIKQEFSAPGTPKKNGVVERKNRTLIEAARTMLEEARFLTYFWDEAVQTACFTQIATMINKHGKTPFEIVKGKNPNFIYFHIFGYPLTIKAFRVYNLRIKIVMKSIHVSFDDKKITDLEDADAHDKLRFENEVPYAELLNPDSDTVSHDITQSSEVPLNNGNSSDTEAYVEGEQHDSNSENTASDTTQGISIERSSDSTSLNSDELNADNYGNTDSGGASENNSGTTQRNKREFINQEGGSSSRSQLPSARKWFKSHKPDLIIGNPDSGVRTRKSTQNECLYHSFLSQTEPKKVEETLQDAD